MAKKEDDIKHPIIDHNIIETLPAMSKLEKIRKAAEREAAQFADCWY